MNLKTHFELEIHFINWHEKSQYSNNSSQTSITLYIGGVHKLRLQEEVGRLLYKCQQM